MSDFMLEYQKTKDKMRQCWKHVCKRTPEAFNDAFNDTFADYIEARREGTIRVAHVSWFRTRMWNNVNRHDPWKARWLKQKNADAPVAEIVMFEKDSETPELNAEDELLYQAEYKEMLANKWGIPEDTECEVCKHLLTGLTVQQVCEVMGWCPDKDSHRVYYKINRQKEQSNG